MSPWWPLLRLWSLYPIFQYRHCNSFEDQALLDFIYGCPSSKKLLVLHSLRPSDAYMHHQPRPSLVQIMACRLFGAKTLSQPMLYYCQLDPYEQTSVKLYSKFKHFHSRKCIGKCRPFCLVPARVAGQQTKVSLLEACYAGC